MTNYARLYADISFALMELEKAIDAVHDIAPYESDRLEQALANLEDAKIELRGAYSDVEEDETKYWDTPIGDR